MGMTKHRAMIVSSHGAEEIMAARRAAVEIFSDSKVATVDVIAEVTGVVSATINGGHFFMIAPTGSFTGRIHEEEAEAAREAFMTHVADFNENGEDKRRFSVEIVMVEFGDVEAKAVMDTHPH